MQTAILQKGLAMQTIYSKMSLAVFGRHYETHVHTQTQRSVWKHAAKDITLSHTHKIHTRRQRQATMKPTRTMSTMTSSLNACSLAPPHTTSCNPTKRRAQRQKKAATVAAAERIAAMEALAFTSHSCCQQATNGDGHVGTDPYAQHYEGEARERWRVKGED